MCERQPGAARTGAGAGFAGRPPAAPVGCAAAAAAAYRAQRADLAGGRDRFRHLLVLVVSNEVLTLLTTAFLLVVHRPLPFGVLVQFRWAGFSMPSVEVEKVCAVLTGALYTLVPPGRWRRRGGWAAAAIVAVIGLSRMRLGVDAPTDVLLGATLGVTVPLLGLRLFAPQESFPVVYGGAHGAHLDLGCRARSRTALWNSHRTGSTCC
jgi:membrane-associated phospholipid phosphatase